MKKKIILSIIIILVIIFAVFIIYTLNNPKIAVLCYHNIGTVEEKNNFPQEQEWTIDVENFEEQLKMLKKHNYKTLTLEEFYNWKQGKIKLPYKSVLITFDDGFLSNYQHAFPLLKKYNMNATVFLIGNYMTEKNEKWSGNLKEYISKETLEKAKEEYPNIDFASHSYALHEPNILQTKSYEELIQDEKDFREKILKTDIYCYPFGAYNNDMINSLKQSNYKMAFIFGPTNKEYRKSSKKDDDYLIPRLNVSYGMNPTKFLVRLLLPF
ncbi:MAG: polysaccharide deacetylase family protein [Clostridia bacterium]|nr:polysaccharide deacetylase family protein [Clostridia bacterium]